MTLRLQYSLMHSQTYKNLIFTTHALERMSDRSISPHAVWQVISAPEKTKSSGEGAKKYIKTLSERKYHIVAKYLAQEQKYLVISVWVRGEDDKVSFVWQLIALPFKFIWWQVKLIVKALKFLFWR